MPICWLRAHCEEVQAVIAQENIFEVMRLSVGTGRLKKADADRIVSEWKRSAGIVTAVRPKTRKDLINALRGMGVG